MILPIYLYGSPVLRQKTEDIAADYSGLKDLIANMRETMRKADGVGLAAPQIGKSIRLIVADGTPLAEDYPEAKGFVKTFINAQIVERAGQLWRYSEGCLSVPKIHEDVERLSRVRLQYVDENFVPHDEWFDGLPARIIQHEYDHLEGKVFIDHLSPIRKQLLKSKLARLSKGNADCHYRVKIQGK